LAVYDFDTRDIRCFLGLFGLGLSEDELSSARINERRTDVVTRCVTPGPNSRVHLAPNMVARIQYSCLKKG
jgi:hypothetical protein